MSDPKPIRGPVYVEATPLLVTLDVSPLVSNNVHDLLTLLSSEEFIDEFMELDTSGPMAFEELHARLVDRLATKVAMTGPQALRVAHRVYGFAEPMVSVEKEFQAAKAALQRLTQQDRRAS